MFNDIIQLTSWNTVEYVAEQFSFVKKYFRPRYLLMRNEETTTHSWLLVYGTTSESKIYNGYVSLLFEFPIIIFQKKRYHRCQTLGFRNGVPSKTQPRYKVGGVELLDYNVISESDMNLMASYDPTLIYGQAKACAGEPFVPAFVELDKKVDLCVNDTHKSL